jgi:hypothetical protein
MKIKLVVATRESENRFFSNTAMGRSLSFNKPPFVELKLFSNNTKGLPSIYNQVIRECTGDPATLIFAHDDLHILDYFWYGRIEEGLTNFDIVGLVGNKRRVPKQPSWAFIDTEFIMDSAENLSGVVGHGNSFPPSDLNIFGIARQQVKLLDGLLIATKSQTLLKNNLYFDEQFEFDFYDLDFCRQAEEKSISCGTWDISLIHESGGILGSNHWRLAYQRYLEKWKE